MSSQNLDVFMPVVILMGIGVIMFAGALIVGSFIRPQKPTALKEQPYECGEDPIGSAWSNFNVRFYVMALVFIIFDVESALLMPVASVFKRFNEAGAGGAVLVSIILFIGVLIEGIAYCWAKGDLDWVKSFQIDPSLKKEDNK